MFLQLRYSSIFLFLFFASLLLTDSNMLSAQSFTKTKKSRTKCLVPDITNPFIKSYITWSGGTSGKYADGTGDLILWEKPSGAKDWKKVQHYQGCEMQNGNFVQVKNLSDSRDSFAYAGRLDEWGRPHGEGEIVWYKHERWVSYKGEFLHGKPHGKGVAEIPRKAMYKGVFQNGHLEGEGILVKHDVGRYVGGFSKSKQHGKGSYYTVSGDSCTGIWQNGKRHGDFTLYSPNGKTQKASVKYVDGVSLEYDAYQNTISSDVISGYHGFIASYPQSDFKEEVQQHLTILKKEFSRFFYRPLSLEGSQKSAGRFKSLFIRNNWEIVFEVEKAGFVFSLSYTKENNWEKGSIRAFQYPNEQGELLSPGFYSLVKKYKLITLYKDGKELATRYLDFKNSHECYQYAWLGFDRGTEQNAIIKSLNIKNSKIAYEEIETCRYESLNSYDISAMNVFLSDFPNGKHADEIRQAKRKRELVIAKTEQEASDRKALSGVQEHWRKNAIRKLQVGDLLCFESNHTDRTSVFGVQLRSDRYKMQVSAYIERISGERYQIRVSDVSTTNSAFWTTPVVNGRKIQRRDIIWVKPLTDSKWHTCN